MNPIDEQEHRENAHAEERKRAKALEERFANDIRVVMALAEGRRLLSAFLLEANVDMSPLRSDVVLMASAIGWQDAAGWWVNAIRKACPEREAQMRAEARKNIPLTVESEKND